MKVFAIVFLISAAILASYELGSTLIPIIVYITIAIRKVGPVVDVIAITWSNKPVSETAAARFVVSDKGENLSPTYAPEIIIPAVIAGEIPRPCPIAKNAIPTVAVVVQEEPQARPTIAQYTTNRQKQFRC